MTENPTELPSNEQPKVGVAMIARNAEELMPLALDPLREHVDEIAIVLGGVSGDATAELAEKYATLPVEKYSGKADEDGRLMHFGDARQQSFEILKRAGVRYAFVVDTDDQWEGAENVHTVARQLYDGSFAMALFTYSYDGGEFIQPRVYDMTTGYWLGPCHNYWEFTTDQPIGLNTNLMHVTQVRPSEKAHERRRQNFHISDEWMKEHGDNARLLLHMAKDAMVERDFDRADNALERYFVAYENDGKQDPEELYNAYHTQAAVYIVQGKHAESLNYALRALTVRSHAQSWTLAAEAASWLAANSQTDRPLLHLSAFCAQMALDTGKARGNLHWQAEKLSGALPLFLQARSLAGLGEFRRARGSLDLGLLIEPENEAMTELRRDICRKLGELE